MKEKEEVFWWNVRKGDFCWITVKSDFCEIWLLGMCCKKLWKGQEKIVLKENEKLFVEREKLLCETDKSQKKKKLTRNLDKKTARTFDECVSWQGTNINFWDIVVVYCRNSCQQETFLVKWLKYFVRNNQTTGINANWGYHKIAMWFLQESSRKKEWNWFCCKNFDKELDNLHQHSLLRCWFIIVLLRHKKCQ